ncbi:hypothetical protein PRUPE_5G206700 [Prunus persica]|uniref:C3H1-type domain-containing protein n=2 Tax=Prunus persica TaxID=3760 RepID=A0A251PBC9_PRUPE|nr:uncharacterized protein LOC18777225 [Prunus persica]XP_020419917.1 uncharacterized protein LOC18777225 [Prunus persica]ONI08891.1 hypothetical protein PRUPE_5G206700 [Prunus persica]ONI08892.1 hypothetical protein PRUPE_5G206700 [Prunus persica]ONI08893.1 hypothetical protein PRUPE_5G206700 [Prunus persica]
MYGQANYGHQFGQGPRTPMTPANNQQRPPALPLPPRQYQQGPPPPLPPVVQQATSVVPPQIGQRGPYLYQHGFPPPPPTVHQSPPIPLRGIPNTGQSYLHPPPPGHGSTLISQCYSNAQHNVQHPSHTGTQNFHRIPPPGFVPPPCPDMSAPHGPLPPPPPPPPPAAAPQGLTLYKTLYPPQPQTGGAQGLQQIPPPPASSASNRFTTTTFGSSVHLTVKDSYMPCSAPLPPASAQPPSAPLPAPPPSSSPTLAAFNFPGHSNFDHRFNKLPMSELRDLDSVDEAADRNEVRHIAAVHEGSQNYEGGSGCEAGSLAGDGLSSNGSLMLDVSPPPPKPTDEKVVQKIEFFCHLIAKNGPGIEDLTRQNEYKNPEFEFLFGGEPGSGAAIAHEYFLWMKKKCNLACKLHDGPNEPPLKSLVIDSSSQPEHLNASSGYSLPADSDMEMEDDITLSDRDQGVNDPIEALNGKSGLIDDELDVKRQLHRPQSSPEWRAAQGVFCEKVSCSLSSELCKLSEGPNLLFEGRSKIEKSPSRVDNVYSAGAAECPLDSDLGKSSTAIAIADDQNKLSTPAAPEANNSDRFSNQFIKVGSPFRLLQDYASDNSSENDDEAFVEDVNVKIVPPSVTAAAKSSHKDSGSHLKTYIGSESPCMSDKESRLPSESRKPYKAEKFSLHTNKEIKDTSTTLITIESHEAFQEKDALAGAGTDVVSRRGKSPEGKKATIESVPPKVDEFGRLVRDGSSDSNSDDSRYNKRHNKRGRSRIRSRSRSPLDSRRRSSHRRRDKRSRSRSWSSRNQRSRSRSPTFRRAGEFRDGNKRQDKRLIPECFDFLRGRCYRGASCRYMHHEYDKNDSSRHHRSKQKHLDTQPGLKRSRIKEETKHTSAMNLHDEIKDQELQDVPIARKDSQLIDPDKINCESSRVAIATVQVKQILPETPVETTTHIPDKKEFQEVLKSHQPSPQLISSADNMKSCDDTYQDVFPLMKKSVVEQTQSNNSVAQLQKVDCPSKQMEEFLVSDLSPDRASKTSPNKVYSSGPLPIAMSSTHVWPMKSSNGQPLSSEQFPYLSQLLPPPPSQGTSAVHVPQLHRDYNLMPPYPLQSTPTGSIHSYQDSLPNQHAQLSRPLDSTWTSLPPPPPRPLYDSSINAGTAARGVSSQFQQNHLVPRNDFGSHTSVRPYPTELPSHSQASDFQHQMYPPVREFHRPLLHREDFGSGNPSSQPFGASGLSREDQFTHAPVQDLNSSNAFAHGNIHPQPTPPREINMHKMQNFSGDNFPSGELLNSSPQIQSRSQNQQPTCGMQYPVGDSILGVPGKTGVKYHVGDSILGFPGKDGPTSQYPTDILDRNQSSHLPDFGASRIPTHHNPYAATFEQPLSSKFSSNILNQENDAPSGNIFDAPSILSQVPVDGQGVGSVGSRQTTSSPSSARAVGQLLPKSDGEQYDPLLDSIEPSSTPCKKSGHGEKQKTPSDSNIMGSVSGSCQPLDLEENNKRKEVDTVASATSLDIDEYGETADAEVGVVEDESLSDPDDAANMAAGEIEIDQRESPGKSKKEKDSRSMRLFKIAIADFVKEILKPSWRQGNMSKEAFKTIVKKTVDKVSGAMKRHQIPKSQAKIDHYIDSSQRKLTKLVMGYVDKYVKV